MRQDLTTPANPGASVPANFSHPQGFHWVDREEEGGLDLASIVRILRENWKLIAASVAAGLVLAIIVTLLMKPL